MLAGAYPIGVLVGGVPSGIATARYGAADGDDRRRARDRSLDVRLRDRARDRGAGRGPLRSGHRQRVHLDGRPRVARRRDAGRPPRRRLIGTALAFAIVGALFGPVLGGVASVVGRGPAFGAAALLSVVLAVWAYRTSAPPPVQSQPLRSSCGRCATAESCSVSGSSSCPRSSSGRSSVLAPLRLDELGFSALAIGALWLCTAALEATANPLVGRITDRVGRIGPMTVLVSHRRSPPRPSLARESGGARGARRRGQHGLRELLDARDGAALRRGRGSRPGIRLHVRADQHRVGSGSGARSRRGRSARASSRRTPCLTCCSRGLS